MPSCHFVHLILLSSGPKVPKSGPFKNEGIHEPHPKLFAWGTNRIKGSSAARHGRTLNRYTISKSRPRTFTLIHEAARCPGGLRPRFAFIPASVLWR